MRQLQPSILVAAASGLLLCLAGVAIAPPPLSAQDSNTFSGARGPGYEGEDREVILICDASAPSTVQRFRAECANTPSLEVDVADCCIPGDHFQVKVKVYDAAPNTAITTSSGEADRFGEDAKVYNYGGTPENPGVLDATIECSYLHGVGLFPAGSSVRIRPESGTCFVSFLGEEERIEE